MPGVVVTTATQAGPANSGQAPSGQAFFVGLLERGATDAPTILSGMADVQKYLGDRPTYGSLYDQLSTFFAEGGIQAVVARVVGTSATKGTLTLVDRASSSAPSTLKVDAANEGAWSSNLQIEVVDGNATNTFRIRVYLNGDVVQDITNLHSPAEAVSKFASSPYVRLTDQGSVTAAPNNNPKNIAPTALTAGNDQRGSVATSDYVDALDLFVPGLGDGAVAIPGQSAQATWDGLIAHAESNNRIAILAAAQGTDISTLKADAAAMDSDAAGLFAPWLVVSDGGFGTRTIGPEGFVMAKRAQAHATVGPWRAPAGQAGKATSILDLDVSYTADQGNDLSESKVSAIRNVANSIRLYDWRSLSTDEDNYYYLTNRDVLDRIAVQAAYQLEAYVFDPIDSKGKLLSAINAELVGLVDPIATAGGLYALIAADGSTIDPGYKVETGSTLNTAQSLATNTIKARLSVRVSPTGGLIELNIVKVGLLSGV